MKALMLAALTAVMLAGCATTGVEIHTLPPQTVAADNTAAIKNAQALKESAAVAAEQRAMSDVPLLPPITAADVPSMQTYDPWERINRFTYRFNARFDEAIFLPVANGYRRLPSPVQNGVHNFFGNLSEVSSMLNFALQGRLGHGARSLGRFAINSTIGIGGLFDVARKVHLPPAPTGFGVTLSNWGMRPGPYIVLPLLGPSTLRDSVGLLGDFGTAYVADVGGLYRTSDNAWMLGVANSIDLRANIDFRYYSSGSAFEYETIRFLYVRKRLIEDAGLPKGEDAPPVRQIGEPAGK